MIGLFERYLEAKKSVDLDSQFPDEQFVEFSNELIIQIELRKNLTFSRPTHLRDSSARFNLSSADCSGFPGAAHSADFFKDRREESKRNKSLQNAARNRLDRRSCTKSSGSNDKNVFLSPPTSDSAPSSRSIFVSKTKLLNNEKPQDSPRIVCNGKSRRHDANHLNSSNHSTTCSNSLCGSNHSRRSRLVSTTYYNDKSRCHDANNLNYSNHITPCSNSLGGSNHSRRSRTLREGPPALASSSSSVSLVMTGGQVRPRSLLKLNQTGVYSSKTTPLGHSPTISSSSSQHSRSASAENFAHFQC